MTAAVDRPTGDSAGGEPRAGGRPAGDGVPAGERPAGADGIQGRLELRERRIVRTSALGIAANALLAGFKAAVGLVSGSIAITLDAVNNLSDALSSVITIVGTKLARKAPDKRHPLGYGRVEYLTSTVIAVIVLYAGLTSLVESVKGILAPQTPDYSAAALVIVAAAVVVKVLLGLHVRSVGRQVGSDALVASGSDALFDSILSASTLAAALVFILAGVSLEAWVGAVISVFIVKAGLEMLRDAMSDILGARVSPEVSTQVKDIVRKDPEALGAYDLLLHAYGPEMLVGDVHVEVADTMAARDIDEMTRRLQAGVYEGTGGKVILSTVGIYAHSTGGDAARIEERLAGAALAHEHVMQAHGFHVDTERQVIDFDVVVDFDAPDREAVRDAVAEEAQAAYPAYRVHVTLDSDLSD